MFSVDRTLLHHINLPLPVNSYVLSYTKIFSNDITMQLFETCRSIHSCLRIGCNAIIIYCDAHKAHNTFYQNCNV